MNKKIYLITNKNSTALRAELERRQGSKAVFIILDFLDEDASENFIKDFNLSFFCENEDEGNYVCTAEKFENKRLFVKNIQSEKAVLRSDVIAKFNIESIISKKFDNKFYPIEIVNLSCGGVGFISDKLFETNQIYEIAIPFSDISLMLFIKLLRGNFDKNKNTYNYGAEFIDLNDEIERILRRNIFNLHLLNDKKILKTIVL